MRPPSLRPSEGRDLREEVGQPSSSTSLAAPIGLRILTARPAKLPSNVVVKYNAVLSAAATLALLPPTTTSHGDFTCFLQCCHLCHKRFDPAMDVYMYRGDQGFCSEECRDRQIFIDEMKELEFSTNKMLASSGHRCSGSPKSEARLLLEEVLRRRGQIPARKTRTIFS